MINLRDSIHNNKLTGDYLIAHLDILSYLQSCNISATNKFSIEVDDDMMDVADTILNMVNLYFNA